MRHSRTALPLLLLLVAGCNADQASPAPEIATDAPAPQTESPSQPASPPPQTQPPPPPEAGASVPEAFRGRYATDAAACARTGDESRLSIEADRIAFHESSGAVVAASGDGEELAITAKLSGEGETWERTYRFRLEDDGRALVDAEGGMRRVRCDAGG